MPFVEVRTSTGKIKYHFVISTPTSANAKDINRSLPVLLFFHSLAFARVFHSQFSNPLLRKFNLVSFDLRAHGETESEKFPEGYGQIEAAEDVIALMDALHLPPCHFVAMDLGTPIALQIAVTHPDRALSLFFISQTCLEEPPEVCEGHVQVYDAWTSSFPGPDSFDGERMMESAYGFSQFMFSNNMTNLAQAMFNEAFPTCQKHWGYANLDDYRISTLEFLVNRKSHSRAALSQLDCPVKLVYGTEDVAYPLAYTERFLHDLKNAGVDVSLCVIPGAPHYVSVDHGDRMDPVLHEFIMQNIDRKIPTAPESVLSPWDASLRGAGWDPNAGEDSDDDEYFVTNPGPTY